MAADNAHLSNPRTLGVACALSATLLGLLYLHAAGAPSYYLLVNALSLALALALLAVIPQSAQGARASGSVVLALGTVLLATSLFGVSVEGASRWVRVGGVSLQVSLIVLPPMLIAFTRSPGILATAGVLVAAVGLALQPDRAMAGVMTASLAVPALYRRERRVTVALVVAAIAFALTLLRPDSLPAVPYVDRILYTSFDVHPLAGFAVLGGALLLIVPGVTGFSMAEERATHATFGLVWLGIVVAAALGNYPTPLVGYGGSAILGYVLSIAFMPIGARSTSAAEASARDPASTDTTGYPDLRVRGEIEPRSAQHLYPRGA